MKQQPCNAKATTPIFNKQAMLIRQQLQTLSLQQIQSLTNTSSKLAQQVYDMIAHPAPTHPALYTYYGEVFKSMNPSIWNAQKLKHAQAKLRIGSAMYGYLRPLDGILPYRLDYTINFEDLGLDDAISFWRDNITEAFLSELKSNEIIINLASLEFSQLFDLARIKSHAHWVTIDFKELVQGKLKTVTMHAKTARGLAVNVLLDKNIQRLKDLDSISHIGEYQLDLVKSSSTNRVYIKK